MVDPKTNSVGLEIFIETGIDVSVATTLHIRYKKPDESVGHFVAQPKIIGKRLGCSYITMFDTDIDQEGEWVFQVYASGVGFELYGNKTAQSFIPPMAGAF